MKELFQIFPLRFKADRATAGLARGACSLNPDTFNDTTSANCARIHSSRTRDMESLRYLRY